MKFLFYIFLLCNICASSFVATSFVSNAQADDFSTPSGLEGRVEFWKLIFAEYGKNHRVFHSRSHPQLIYSVLDFSEYENAYSEEESFKRRKTAIDQEILNIKSALTNLSKGLAPSSNLERRISRIFNVLPAGVAKYKKALEKKEIRYQRGVKEKFEQGLIRSGRYLPIIKQILASEGLPEEIGRLPLVESSFDYKAYSSVGAAGIWQFMRSTGKLYMTVNYAIDERRDPVIATRAAAKYLRNSYDDLGRWPLAITSYNHGLGGVRNAVKKSGSRDLAQIIKTYKSKTFGFASSNFYAEFLAALEIERNAQTYFPGLVREQVWNFDEVVLGKSTFFKDLVRMEGGDTSRIKELNLALRDAITSNKVKIPEGTVIKVPLGRADRIIANVSGSKKHQINSGLVKAKKIAQQYRVHKVRKGETLSRISRKYRTSLHSVLRANRLKSRSVIRVGQRIKIPGANYSPPRSSAKKRTNRRKASRVHIVKKGQTLLAIARKYKVSLSKLTKFNSLNMKKTIQVGQRIKIP